MFPSTPWREMEGHGPASDPDQPEDGRDRPGSSRSSTGPHPAREEGPGPAESEHLLSGILVDGKCSMPLYAVQKPGDFPQRVYRCHRGSGGCGNASIAQGRADVMGRGDVHLLDRGGGLLRALARRQAELLAGSGTAEELDDWREEIQDLDQVQGTRFYGEEMRQRHVQLRRLVDQATARLMAQPDLQAMADLPRSEDELRRAWDRWSVRRDDPGSGAWSIGSRSIPRPSCTGRRPTWSRAWSRSGEFKN